MLGGGLKTTALGTKMYRVKITIILFSLLLTNAVSAQNNKNIVSLKELNVLDTLFVKYNSQGCFHHCSYSFVFYNNNGLFISINELVGLMAVLKDNKLQRESGFKATFKLSSIDTKNIEKLLRYYSHNKEDGCTTVDSIFIQYKHNNEIIKDYTVVDGSCEIDNKKNIVSFYDFISSAKKRFNK